MTGTPGNFRGHRHHRGGFVLLVTLVLLTLAALAMIAMSRTAVLRAQAAEAGRADLQRQWGCLSCQRFVLPQCLSVLQHAESQRQQPTAVWKQTLLLGEQSFDLTFSDESAKANVSTLIERQGLQQAEESVRRLSLGSPSAAGEVRLRLSEGRLGPECFGDVFDPDSPNALFNHDLGPSPMEMLTCWSDGRANIQRAPEDVLREACSRALDLTQIHLLAIMQRTVTGLTVDEAFRRLQATAKQRNAAEAVLTDHSSCCSLWIECYTRRRSYWSLSVARANHSDGPDVLSYEW